MRRLPLELTLLHSAPRRGSQADILHYTVYSQAVFPHNYL